jgi:Fe-S-cluster containining protein
VADKFSCWGCGACCRFVGFKLPELDRGDRACIHLLEDNSCAIYEDRPAVCRLNPETPVEVQTKVCELQERNWQQYVKTLEGLTESSGCGILVADEKDDG